MIDLLLHNARIMDVFRLRLFHGWVAVRGDRFLYVEEGDLPPDVEARETRDLDGAIIAPGLIDSHMHIESSLITPRRFAEAVLPWGTTTILSDPHEVGNVAGERGVRWMIGASSGLPLRVYHAIPSCIPATSPEFEWTPQVFDAEVVSRLAELPTVIALGEVMDYQGLIGASGRLQQIVSFARQRGLLIEGHIPTLQGTELSAYLAHGVSSDHTLATPKKIYEQISKSVVVMLQTKSLTAANAAAVLALPDRSRVLLVTDDFEPTLLQAGHLSRMIQLAVAVDVPPLDAWAMATAYPARYLGLRDLGAIAPGFRADFMLLVDLVEFPPHEVFVGGELVAKAGSYAHSTLPEPAVQPEPVRLPGPLTARDFRLAAPLENGRMTLNTVALQTKTTTLTRLESVQIELHDGYAVLEEDDGLALIVVIARNGESKSVGLIRGTGLKSGAFASTVAHDSHNLLVIGRDVESMVTAANAVHTMSGGVAVARGDALCAQLALPYFGLLSDAPAQDVARNLAAVEACLVEQGVDLKRPFLTLSIMTLTVSPFVKFTDRGLIDTERRELLPTIINEA